MTLSNHHCIESANLSWSETAHPGVRRKELGLGCAVLELAGGASLPPEKALEKPDRVFEAFLLEGALETPRGTLGRGDGFLQRADVSCAATAAGCTLFLRAFDDPQGAATVSDYRASKDPWLPGQGGLRVKPLGQGSALVHWPAGERFVPHKHWGGEEIFVLSGTFQDEHGSYPAGTWLQSPHLSAHHPFVSEETVIWVKTGHLHPGAPAQ